MQVADWALFVSLVSVSISIFSLGWNIWSKWIHPKPKIKVSFSVMILMDGTEDPPPFLCASATNFGPTDTTLRHLIARSRPRGWWFKIGRSRRWVWGIMNCMQNPQNAISEIYDGIGGLPIKLSVGEEFSTYLIFKHAHLRDDGIVDVGFDDIFGRYHWAPRSNVRKVISNIRSNFKDSCE